MLTAAIGLLAAAGYGLGDYFSLRLIRSAALLTTLIWILFVGVAASVPLALAAGGLPDTSLEWAAVGRAALGGALYIATFACLLTALRRGSLSVVSPITGLAGALAAVVVIALGERVDLVTSVALAVAVSGGLLASIGRGMRTASGAFWAVMTACLSAVTLMLYGSIGTTITPLTTVAVSRAVGLAIVAPVVLLVRPPRFAVGLRRDAWLAALLETCGFIAAAAALMRGPVSVASVMITQFPVFGVVLGLLILHERPARHQLIGVLLTLSAVSILATR